MNDIELNMKLKELISELNKKDKYGYTDNFIFDLIVHNMESTDGSDEVICGIREKLESLLK